MRADHSLTARLKDPQNWINLILALTLLGLWTGHLAPDETRASQPAPASPAARQAVADDTVQAQWVVAGETR